MNNQSLTYELDARPDNEALNRLYAAAWPDHRGFDFRPVLARSLAHVCAFEQGELIGFVYVAWDGCQHAFLLEPTVHPRFRRRGIGRELVGRAETAARDAGCEWLHVDFESELEPFYRACGFRPTPAGLIRLQ